MSPTNSLAWCHCSYIPRLAENMSGQKTKPTQHSVSWLCQGISLRALFASSAHLTFSKKWLQQTTLVCICVEGKTRAAGLAPPAKHGIGKMGDEW
eukprot:Skav230752  [mRNA]  locus=scaffold3436:161992:169382:- [translate_table: standard]